MKARMPAIQYVVMAALWASGFLKSGTLSAIASTPVMELQPLAKERNIIRSMILSIGGLTSDSAGTKGDGMRERLVNSSTNQCQDAEQKGVGGKDESGGGLPDSA